jgi:DNA primase
MITYKDLKSVAYIDEIIVLRPEPPEHPIKKKREKQYAAFCPFHNDTKDSFRVYVKEKGDVRFHCFTACNAEWDVYNLIMLRKKCNFEQAQMELAKVLGVDEFEMFHGQSDSIPDKEEEPDEPLNLSEPEELTPEMIDALDRAVQFYHVLLMSDGKLFGAICKYLSDRSVGENMIRDFKIGYCPPFKDEKFRGRGLLCEYLDLFMSDHHVLSLFYEAGLFRLLNDQTASGLRPYRNFISPTRKDPFSQNYADYFAGRITFPIYDAKGHIQGFMGRRPNNQGIKWIK